MIAAGMNVARLNMSHGDPASHRETWLRVRQAAAQMNTTIAIMLDTRGREIRTKKVKDGQALIERHQGFTLYGDDQLGDATGVSTTYDNLHQHALVGDRILLDDGQLELAVTEIQSPHVVCRVVCGGVLRNNKGVNLPDNKTAFDDIPADDGREVEFASQNPVDYIAASFIRNANDVNTLRSTLTDRGIDIPIIAKIENREGVDNLHEIIDAADGIMVARGDLGVELEMGEGPTVQKRIIRATVSRGKPVITATQMLDSMERNPRPTRAEISDVANAIFDGTSAVMLSGETAAGRRPVESLETMVELAKHAEMGLDNYGYLQQIDRHPSNEVTEAVAQASITMANHIQAKAIIALTETGLTARLISKYRPDCTILAITSSCEVVTRLAMNWGVLALQYDGDGSDDDRFDFATNQAKSMGYLDAGELVVMTAGSSRQAGSTNLIRVLTVD